MASNNNNSNNNNHESSNSNGNKQLQKQLKERKQEMLLFERFKRVATLRLEAMTRQSEASGIKYQMGEGEKAAFQQLHGMGIKEGIAAGVVTFLVLRKGPIYIGRWVYQRRMMMAQQQQQHQQQNAGKTGMNNMNTSMHNTPPPGDGSYQLSNPNSTFNSNSNSNSNNPFQVALRKDFPRSKNFVIRTIWFAFDSMLSLMMAASVSMAYTDTDKIRDQLTELPLLPGRSLVSDALCDDIVKELQKVKAEKDPAYQRLVKQLQLNHNNNNNHSNHNNHNHDPAITPASFYLEGIIAFSENCQRRRFVEQRIRQEQGLSEHEPVEIKEPIPHNGPRLLLMVDDDDDNNDDNDNNNNNSNNLHQIQVPESGTFLDTDFKDFEWNEAADFTTDQEEEQPNNMENRPKKKR